uniref:Uncharacterized protein n=1 Tax=Arundo donax TaxID=35708 RepID=A0A0A9GG97_ARUDO
MITKLDRWWNNIFLHYYLLDNHDSLNQKGDSAVRHVIWHKNFKKSIIHVIWIQRKRRMRYKSAAKNHVNYVCILCFVTSYLK